MPKKLKLTNDLVVDTLRRGDVELFKQFIPQMQMHPTIFKYALQQAAYEGTPEIVKFLLPYYEQSDLNMAGYEAAFANRLDILEILIPLVDKRYARKAATIWVETHGIKRIIPEFLVRALWNDCTAE
jgi:hypothetical protein